MDSEKKVRTRPRVLEKLGNAFDLPPECIPGEGILTLVGGRHAVVAGCLAVLVCEREKIVLRVPDGMWTLHGEEMTVLSYIRDQITVQGKIRAVETGEDVRC